MTSGWPGLSLVEIPLIVLIQILSIVRMEYLQRVDQQTPKGVAEATRKSVGGNAVFMKADIHSTVLKQIIMFYPGHTHS